LGGGGGVGVTWVAVWVFLFLCWIPMTVRTTNVFTIRANLHSSQEQRGTLMTCPPNSLHGHLPHQRLPTSPTRHRQDVFLPHTPIRIWLNSSLNGRLECFILLPLLRLGFLNRIARTLGATCMLTCSTDFVPTERGLAFVTYPVDAHPDWLLDAQRFFVGLGGELVRFDDGKFEAFAQFVGSLGVDLRPHNFHRLWSIFCGDCCGCLFDWSWSRCGCRFGGFGCAWSSSRCGC